MSKVVDKRVFEVNEVKYAVRRPTMQELTEANKIRSETFNMELQAGSLLRDQLDAELRKRKLWNDDREEKYQTLRKEIIDSEYALARGNMKLSEGVQLALKMRKNRDEMTILLSSRTDLDSNTCEGRADAARFNYLFACCLVYEEDGRPYFPNGLADYLLNVNDEVASRGATEFFYLLSGANDSDSKLPENKFLKKFNLVDEKYRLINKQKQLVDEKGRCIDENGNFIKWKDKDTFVFVDSEGRELDDEGNFIVEEMPFFDDDGNPIVLSNNEPEVVADPKTTVVEEVRASET